MSIETEITALTTDRSSIRTALVNRGISAASAHGFDDFAGDIGDIPNGSSYIVVTAPTGSAVTLTKPDSTTVTGTEVSGTWTFGGLTALGTYTVTAAVGGTGTTKTKSVLIDTVGTYDVTISQYADIIRGKMFQFNSDNIVDQSLTFITDYFPVTPGHSVTAHYGYSTELPQDQSGCFSFLIEYTSGKVYREYYSNRQYGTERTFNLCSNTYYCRFCDVISKLNEAYLYDNTDGVYLWKYQ